MRDGACTGRGDGRERRRAGIARPARWIAVAAVAAVALAAAPAAAADLRRLTEADVARVLPVARARVAALTAVADESERLRAAAAARAPGAPLPTGGAERIARVREQGGEEEARALAAAKLSQEEASAIWDAVQLAAQDATEDGQLAAELPGEGGAEADRDTQRRMREAARLREANVAVYRRHAGEVDAVLRGFRDASRRLRRR